MVKQIPLSQGKFALVDDEDYERVSQYKWSLRSGRGKKKYAHRDSGDGMIDLHVFVLGKSDGHEIDHRDGDGLNNTKDNLRHGTHSQNTMNRDGWSKHGYKGVCKVNSWHKFSARIQVAGKMIWLGSYDTAEAAAQAYDDAALVHHGEFARFNYPVQG